MTANGTLIAPVLAKPPQRIWTDLDLKPKSGSDDDAAIWNGFGKEEYTGW